MNEINKKYFNAKSIRFKIVFSLSLSGLLLVAMIVVLLNSSLTKIEEKLTNDKFNSDIKYAIDELSENNIGATWYIDDKCLYFGNVMIGDGDEKVNVELEEKIEHFEEITNSLFYFSVRTKDFEETDEWGTYEKVVYSSDLNYYMGHYKRVCGNMTNKDGLTLRGSYIDKNIADDIETDFRNCKEGTKKGVYSGSSNVIGEKMFCRYETLTDENGEIVGLIAVGKKNADMIEYIAKQRTKSIILYIVFMLLGVGGVAFLCTKMVGHLQDITKRLREIGEGHFDLEPLSIKTNDEIEIIAENVNEMAISLKDKQRIGSELGVATNIQAAMLPRKFPAFPDRNEFDIYASMTPAKEVGGDFYDFFFIDKYHLAFTIADVSGKGVPAALVMAITKALIKAQALSKNQEPKDILTNVNNTICEGNDYTLFITCWLGILDLRDGKLKFTNAGHNPPLVKHNSTFTYLTPRHGLVLGGMSGVNYRQDEITLEKGDAIYLYTDGVTEATSKEIKLYGEERLEEFLNSHNNLTPKDTIEGVFKELIKFMDGVEQFDDITMLMVDYFGNEMTGEVLEVDATVENLDTVNEFIEEQGIKLNLSRKTITQLLICVEEIYVNIAHYAYGKETGKAYIEFTNDKKKLEIIFKDKGMKFDPLAKKDPDITLRAEDRDIGGLGILMVKKTMDDVKYEYKDGYNILTIVKNIEA